MLVLRLQRTNPFLPCVTSFPDPRSLEGLGELILIGGREPGTPVACMHMVAVFTSIPNSFSAALVCVWGGVGD
jgi:hypothetical protein